ncbi:hypothetical protein FBUS_04446 [Fasciolopsis buskii]|uniref:Uncharacterized protein n=1 Tax=Fasciolopsis buskii TaxID=27845 RepID=A0A8E0RR47_9TREM|nr:hypothetical protein FBUS_04446 [Fasciolopsis buski]
MKKKTNTFGFYHSHRATETSKSHSRFFVDLPSLNSVHEAYGDSMHCVMCSCIHGCSQCETKQDNRSASRWPQTRLRGRSQYRSDDFQFHTVKVPQSTGYVSDWPSIKSKSHSFTTDTDDIHSRSSFVMEKINTLGRSISCTQLTDFFLRKSQPDDSAKR